MKTIALSEKKFLVLLGGSNGMLAYAHIDRSVAGDMQQDHEPISAEEDDEVKLNRSILYPLNRGEQRRSSSSDIFQPLFHADSTTITTIVTVIIQNRTGVPATLIAVADSDGLISLWIADHGSFDAPPSFQSIRKVSTFGNPTNRAIEQIHMLSFVVHEKIDLLIGSSSRLIMVRLQSRPRYAMHSWMDMDRSHRPCFYAVNHPNAPAVIIWKIVEESPSDENKELEQSPTCRLHRYDWPAEKYRSAATRLTQVLKT